MTLSLSDQAKYLSELGIEPWYPRVLLNNALIPTSFVESPSSQPISSPLEATIASQPIRPQLDTSVPEHPIAAAPISQALVNSEEAVQQQAITTVVSSEELEAPIRFALQLYVIDDCLVASSLTANYVELQNPASKLMNAILKVIFGGDGYLHHEHLISWPFFASPNASQGVSSAQKYVNGVVEHLIEAHRVKKILGFGGVLAKLNGWSSVCGDLFSVPYLLLPSIYKMLQDPTLKSKAWQVIQQSDFMCQ